MNDLSRFYETAKQSAKDHMKKGQINAYLEDLLIMNHYKRQIDSI